MNLEELEKKLEIDFNDKNLLQKSLTHRSLLNEKNTEGLEHNERLEFLGDAVLELIISEYLFHKYTERPEGELTSFRAAVVNTNSLGEISKNLEIGKYMLMSKGEEMTGGREKEYLLANVFEALLGAIYLDKGYDKATEFVTKHVIPKIDHIVKYRLDIDAKTKLQEYSQRIHKNTPSYKVIKEEGPDHSKIFTVVVKIKKEIVGTGSGKNKQKAEEQAAENALEDIDINKIA